MVITRSKSMTMWVLRWNILKICIGLRLEIPKNGSKISQICLLYIKSVRKIEVSSYVENMMGNLFRWSVFENLEALFPIIVMWYRNYKVYHNILDLQCVLVQIRFTLSKIKLTTWYKKLYIWVASKLAKWFKIYDHIK